MKGVCDSGTLLWIGWGMEEGCRVGSWWLWWMTFNPATSDVGVEWSRKRLGGGFSGTVANGSMSVLPIFLLYYLQNYLLKQLLHLIQNRAIFVHASACSPIQSTSAIACHSRSSHGPQVAYPTLLFPSGCHGSSSLTFFGARLRTKFCLSATRRRSWLVSDMYSAKPLLQHWVNRGRPWRATWMMSECVGRDSFCGLWMGYSWLVDVHRRRISGLGAFLAGPSERWTWLSWPGSRFPRRAGRPTFKSATSNQNLIVMNVEIRSRNLLFGFCHDNYEVQSS